MSKKLIIKTNELQKEHVLIKDMGIFVPKNGGHLTLDAEEDLDLAAKSKSLEALLNDGIFGGGNSTLQASLIIEEDADYEDLSGAKKLLEVKEIFGLSEVANRELKRGDLKSLEIKIQKLEKIVLASAISVAAMTITIATIFTIFYF